MAYNPLVQPDASTIEIFFQPDQNAEMVTTEILVETSLAQENHYVERPSIAIRVFVTVEDQAFENESLDVPIKVIVTVNDISNVESLIAITVKAKMRLIIWQRTKTGFILVGDPPRRI